MGRGHKKAIHRKRNTSGQEGYGKINILMIIKECKLSKNEIIFFLTNCLRFKIGYIQFDKKFQKEIFFYMLITVYLCANFLKVSQPIYFKCLQNMHSLLPSVSKD